MSDDTLILHPDEVRKRRESKKQDAKIEIPEETIIQNFADSVKIEYESMGRFSTPSILHFKDYTNKQVNDFVLSSRDELLDVIISILQNNILEENIQFKVENMTAEDLLETLIAIKIKFESQWHTHYWLCDCQMEKDDKDRIINEQIIDLLSLDYKSINQVDEDMKIFMKERFDSMSDNEFKEYIVKKYTNNPIDDLDSYTREMEINKIEVKEPFKIFSGNDIYSIIYPRLFHVLKAKKYAEKIYLPKIKNIQNRKEANIPLAELKEKKERDIKALKQEQAKTLILFAKAMMIETKNNKVLSDEEKFKEYSEVMSRNTSKNIDHLFNKIQFGLNSEIELICPICGNIDKGRLRDIIDPRQLLPNGDDGKSHPISSKRESGFYSGFDICFGI